MTTIRKTSYKILRRSLIATSLCAMLGFAFSERAETYEPVVQASELSCLSSDFDSYFSAGLTSTTRAPLAEKTVRVLISSLDSAISDAKKEGLPSYALRIHHGLTRTGSAFSYAPAISFGVLTADQEDDWDFTPTDAGSVHRITSDNKLLHTSYGAWSSWQEYLMHMYVQPNSAISEVRQVVKDEEVETYTFKLSEVEALLQHNSEDAYYLVVHSVAEPLFHDGSDMRFMRHHVCLVTARSNGELLIDTTTPPAGQPYQHRGLDTGSPCPPRCGKVYLPANGTPVRKNC